MRWERTISKRKKVYYETEECGSVLSERRTRLHYATKKLGYSTRRKRIVPLILHWLSFFDTDSTEKLRVHCQTERLQILGVHVCTCVKLYCTLCKASFGERKKNQVVPAYIEPSHHCTVPALLLFCDTQSECGSNEEE